MQIKNNYPVYLSIFIVMIFILNLYISTDRKYTEYNIRSEKLLAELQITEEYQVPAIEKNNKPFIDDILPELKDPFRNIFFTETYREAQKSVPITTAINLSSFILSGIVTANGVTYAIINDQIVKENEFISGVQVKKIMKDQVVLEKNDKLYYIKMRLNGDVK